MHYMELSLEAVTSWRVYINSLRPPPSPHRLFIEADSVERGAEVIWSMATALAANSWTLGHIPGTEVIRFTRETVLQGAPSVSV